MIREHIEYYSHYGLQADSEAVRDWEEDRFNKHLDALRAKCHLIPRQDSGPKRWRNRLIGLATNLPDHAIAIINSLSFRQVQTE